MATHSLHHSDFRRNLIHTELSSYIQCINNLKKNTFLSRCHTWRFYTPIAANLIASENRERISSLIDADTLGDLFTLIAAIWHFNIIPRLRPGRFPLILVAISVKKKIVGTGTLGECKISAILYAKIAIAAPGTPGDFLDRRDRRIKSPGVSSALAKMFIETDKSN